MDRQAGERIRAFAPRQPALAGGRRVPVLFFDATRFERDDEGAEPARPPAPRPGEWLPLTVLAVLLILLAVLPISAAAAGDLWRYLFG